MNVNQNIGNEYSKRPLWCGGGGLASASVSVGKAVVIVVSS